MGSRGHNKRGGAKERAKQAGAPLSPERAFVVQLQGDRPGPGQRLAGRVEHLVSGEARRFASLAELGAFMGRVPARGRPRPAREPRP